MTAARQLDSGCQSFGSLVAVSRSGARPGLSRAKLGMFHNAP